MWMCALLCMQCVFSEQMCQSNLAAIMPRSMTICCLQWLSSLGDNCSACPSRFAIREDLSRIQICSFTDSGVKMSSGCLTGRLYFLSFHDV